MRRAPHERVPIPLTIDPGSVAGYLARVAEAVGPVRDDQIAKFILIMIIGEGWSKTDCQSYKGGW
jgi:hypothetical protein